MAQPKVSAKQRQFDFDLPAQSMTKALLAFSRVTGLQVATSPAKLNGLQANRLRGRMPAEAALRVLTAGTAIDGRIVGDTVVVERQDRTDFAQATGSAETASVASDDQNGGEEIVVTGYRESLSRAAQLKRSATGSQDVIVAQDIAAFPDQNLAESLQRVPGVAITRDSGEGRQISLRGLGPDFTRTQLNGMEVLTNTASGLDSRGSVSRSRSFDYSIFASELFNQVTVEKSYAAEQDEGGIGGTIGLHTAKPFDYPGLTAVVSAKGQVNQYSKTLTPRLVGLISDRWGDFGALVSVAYSKAETIEMGYRNWNWSQINFRAANVGPNVSAADRALLVNATGANRVWNSRAQTYATWFNERERLGVTAALQYHPNDRTDVTLDVLYGKLTNNRETDVLGAGGTNGVAANDITGTQVLTDVTFDEHNSIVAASFDGVDMRTETRNTHDTTDFWQVALNGRTDITDTLSAKVLGGWSRSKFQSGYDQVYLESVGQSYSFSGINGDNPTNSYGFDPVDPAQWGVQGAETREDGIDSEFYNAKGELAWRVAEGSTLKAGASYKHFENGGLQRRAQFNYDGKPGLPVVPTRVIPYSSRIPYIIADIDGAYQALGLSGIVDASNAIAGADYQLREKTFAAYAQYDLNTRLGEVGVRANLGLRYYRTSLNSSGTALTGTTLTPVDITNSYDGFLPAANLAFDLDRSLVLRVSANRNVNRAALNDMRAAATINTAAFGGTISAGNPNLAPFIADSVEGSLEYYDGKRGSLAVGVFYKKMKSFITTETTPVPYNTTGFPLSLLLPGQDPAIVFNYTRPVNGPGAAIKGIEIAGKRDFDFLPAPFDSLGVLGNVTLAEGKTDVLFSSTPVSLPLTNLSKVSTNATIYYDTGRWGVRGSAAMRSKYRSGSGGNGNIGEYIKGTTNFDASAYVNVTSQLQLTLEAINIGNEPIVQYADKDAKRMMTNTVSGRTVLFGATMRF
jgi:iron complex outermembrane receptor protein